MSDFDSYTVDEVIEGLWLLYDRAGPMGDAGVAKMLGSAYYRPGQKTAQDAFPANRPINIMDLSNFSAGWKWAKNVYEFDVLINEREPELPIIATEAIMAGAL